MKHFNPLTGCTTSAQPVLETDKPKRARAKAKPKATDAAVAVTPPTAAKPVALDNALAQAAERVPLAAYAAMLVTADRDAISTKAAFVAYCGGHPARDWRIAWKAFEGAGYPGADDVGKADAVATEPHREGAGGGPGKGRAPEAAPTPAAPAAPSNIIQFVRPKSADPLDALLSSLR